MKRIRVLVSGHDAALRESLAERLAAEGIDVVGMARSPGEAVALCGRLRPDVAIVDMTHDGRELRAASPETSILACFDESIEQAPVRGVVDGYVRAAAPGAELAAAIRMLVTARGPG